jgi:hypothetical protein
MHRYSFYVKDQDVQAVKNVAEQDELVGMGYQKIDFESEVTDHTAAIKDLQRHLAANTEATKNFTGDITFSSIIESLLHQV